jgi:hypothetical protein
MDIMENNYFNGRYPRVINPETKVDANSVYIVRFFRDSDITLLIRCPFVFV